MDTNTHNNNVERIEFTVLSSETIKKILRMGENNDTEIIDLYDLYDNLKSRKMGLNVTIKKISALGEESNNIENVDLYDNSESRMDK